MSQSPQQLDWIADLLGLTQGQDETEEQYRARLRLRRPYAVLYRRAEHYGLPVHRGMTTAQIRDALNEWYLAALEERGFTVGAEIGVDGERWRVHKRTWDTGHRAEPRFWYTVLNPESGKVRYRGNMAASYILKRLGVAEPEIPW